MTILNVNGTVYKGEKKKIQLQKLFFSVHHCVGVGGKQRS